MEHAKKYRLDKPLERRLFPIGTPELDIGQIAIADQEVITLAAGTEVEMISDDASHVAQLKILNGEHEGRTFPSSPRTQTLFTEVR